MNDQHIKVSHDQAAKSAQRLINSHFKNEERAKISLPAHPDDDDLVITRYVTQQKELIPKYDNELARLRGMLREIIDSIVQPFLDNIALVVDRASLQAVVDDFNRPPAGEVPVVAKEVVDNNRAAVILNTNQFLPINTLDEGVTRWFPKGSIVFVELGPGGRHKYEYLVVNGDAAQKPISTHGRVLWDGHL